jgi:nucleoside-diphosphate-sugar epimerase
MVAYARFPDGAMNIALVGGSGFVGSAIARRCRTDGHNVVVLDRAPPRVATPFFQLDLLDDDVAVRLTQAFRAHAVDVVVHLAARVDPPRDARERARMARLHEHGTRAVVAAVDGADVRRVVLVSSAVVYGARAENPVPLSTTAPVDPGGTFAYAVDKARQEAIVSAGLDAARTAIVRPAIIYGGGARNYLTEIIRRARLPVLGRGLLPALDGRRPPLQFVHVDDVATIVLAAAVGPPGIFHAAPIDWVAYEDVARIAGLRVVDVPVALVAPVLDALVRVMPPELRAPRALLPWLMYPFVLDMRDTITALGVTPDRGSRDALRAILEER